MKALLTVLALWALWPRAAGDLAGPFAVAEPWRPAPRASWTVPRRAYGDVRRVALPGATTTGVQAMPDGRVVVGVWASGGGGLALVDPADLSACEVRLPERVSRPLAVGPDGTVYAIGDTPTLYVVAPDGTLRASVPLPNAGLAVPAVRPDGTVAIAAQMTSTESEILLVGARGEALGHRRVPATILGPPVVLGEELLVPIPGGTLRLLPGGGIARNAGLPGAGAVTASGDTLVAAAGNAVELLGPTGGLRRVVELGAPVPSAFALSSGRALALRLGTPPELFLLAPSGEVLARVPAVVSAGRPLEGSDGAMVVPSGAGELLALEADGRPRWIQRVGDSLRLPAAALPGGGLAVAAPSAMVLLREAPASDAR
ncbi:MAG: hypothetical protein HY909_05955 [Deltaproteobacteria bacterium]|nr:hypothetical protein [Deltaproteobacteria bacterium]